jgi:hypothetical protein
MLGVGVPPKLAEEVKVVPTCAIPEIEAGVRTVGAIAIC